LGNFQALDNSLPSAAETLFPYPSLRTCKALPKKSPLPNKLLPLILQTHLLNGKHFLDHPLQKKIYCNVIFILKILYEHKVQFCSE